MSSHPTANPETVKIFKKAVCLNDVKTVKKCLRLDVNPNVGFLDRIRALHIAAEHGNRDMLKILLKQKNIIIDPVSRHGYTPLMFASQIGNDSITEYLISKGADIHAQDYFGRTPLHLSVINNNYESTLILLKAGANPNKLDSNGATPFYFAVVTLCNYNLASILQKFKADSLISEPGCTNIFLELCLTANTAEYQKIILLLLKRISDVSVCDPVTKRTGLHMAAISNYVPVAQILLDCGANRDVIDISGCRPIDIAMKFRHIDMAIFLETYIPYSNENQGKNIPLRTGRKKRGKY